MKSLHDIGEFGFINRMKQLLPKPPEHMIGIGDDCAVIHKDHAPSILLTTDLLIERIHFLRTKITPRELGRKSLAVNLSDIAAMGGIPQWALISIAIPPDLSVAFCEQFYQGLNDLCVRYSVSLLGGDTTSSPAHLMINIVLGGECNPETILYRSGAHPNERIFLSGAVGSSAAGLHLLLNSDSSPIPDCFTPLITAHNDPEPELALGRCIAESGLASSMIDVSDGVIADLNHICEESHVGATIYAAKIPRDSICIKAGELTHCDSLAWALTGGEDYRLLITVPDSNVSSLQQLIKQTCQRTLIEIGYTTDQSGIVVRDENGIALPFKASGWDHFK